MCTQGSKILNTPLPLLSIFYGREQLTSGSFDTVQYTVILSGRPPRRTAKNRRTSTTTAAQRKRGTRVTGGRECRAVYDVCRGRTFFLLSPAYSHGAQESHFPLLAVARSLIRTTPNAISDVHLLRVRSCCEGFEGGRREAIRVTKSRKSRTDGRADGRTAEIATTEPTGVNYLSTIDHYYYVYIGGGTGFRSGDNYCICI